jgi:radical SAM superfamily enzyme YgiQ (UPF0313 family)
MRPVGAHPLFSLPEVSPVNILLVYPATPRTFWSFTHALPFISRRAAFPPLGLLTIAAMLPREWSVRLIDINVTRLTDADIDRADYVLLSAMLVHASSATEVIDRCAARGKTVIAGGPLFTTGHEQFANLRHVVKGEAEELMPRLVADMLAGDVKALYQAGGFPDITRTPIPRWDLIKPRHYATMSVQFSRGCPFNCEFCDIIVMNGRVPRSKSPDQVIAELDALIAAGWRETIFIVDDNFIGNRARVKSLLRRMIEWRAALRRPPCFTTEASLNIVDDPELLDLTARAGVRKLFVGIESPADASLAECGKVQNTQRDLVAAVRTIHQAGIEVMGGFIVGFDSDTAEIFDCQMRFIQEAGVATAMVGLLTALPETRLYKRLRGEGRILARSTGNNLDAVLNFIPRMDRGTLVDGYRNLVKHLYAPDVYYQRALTFLKTYRPSADRMRLTKDEFGAFLKSLWVLGIRRKGRRAYWRFLLQAFIHHRNALGEAIGMAITGFHFRQIARGI